MRALGSAGRPARLAGARGKHKVLVIDHVKNFPN
jgi:hypothetical protein